MTTYGGYRRGTETATIERRSIATGGAQHAQCKSEPTQTERKAHTALLGLCDNQVNALKLLANQQKDGDSPIHSIITGLHERSRRGIVDGLTRFIEADSHSAVDVGDLRRGTNQIV